MKKTDLHSHLGDTLYYIGPSWNRSREVKECTITKVEISSRYGVSFKTTLDDFEHGFYEIKNSFLFSRKKAERVAQERDRQQQRRDEFKKKCRALRAEAEANLPEFKRQYVGKKVSVKCIDGWSTGEIQDNIWIHQSYKTGKCRYEFMAWRSYGQWYPVTHEGRLWNFVE